MQSFLFVCLGNICRSPTAKAMFDYKLSAAGIEAFTDSAGTLGYHVGRPPDPRAIHHASRWGMDISVERARQVTLADFRRFNRIYAMDQSNLDDLERLRPPNATARVELVMSLAPDYGLCEVPDPYYGGDQGFEQVLDMLETAATRLVEELKQSR
ncbi:MAG: low molecular weight phosphotyrosine protein phosphatase [Wenzhouxiangella sp.]|nr:low molecular weight phosphotyrosine protein phosphatase [Wenzhouxiangella sp.]MCH8477820.1 low molecular weight phosphotyrosine protein phosphatase [Wenzhouxiangella sp.]TVR94271.1 MAG: low molecular weight phosphotyrosine protein phosphatase [Wenzhouxiangellaceae bacterium]